MSMMCWLLAVTPAQVAALRAEPALASAVAEVVQTSDRDAVRAEAMMRLPPEQRAQFEAQILAAMQSMPGAREAQARLAEAGERVAKLGELAKPLDLGKSWHILHYLFTGRANEAEAPGNALLTGAPVGEDLGYGPPRLHAPEQTRAFSDFLSSLETSRLQARVNIAEMRRAGVYSIPMGSGAEAEYESQLGEEVASRFPSLQAYVGRASEHGSALLVWLS